MSRSISEGFFYIFGSKIGSFVLSIIITPVLIRILGSSDYGNYAFIISIIAVLSLITSSGVSTGLRKYISEDRNYPNWKEHVLAFYFKLGILVAILVALPLAFAPKWELTSILIRQELYIYFYIIPVILVARQLFSISTDTLRGLEIEKLSDPLLIIRRGIFGLIAIALSLLGWGVMGVLIGELVSLLVIFAFGIYYMKRYLDLSLLIHPSPDNFPRKKLFLYNFSNIVLLSFIGSLYHIDILLLNPMVGSQETGYYKGALIIAEFIWFVPMAVQIVLVHSTSELWASGKVKQITEIATRTTRYTILLTTLLAIGLVSLLDDFVLLYLGQDMAPSTGPLLLLIPGALGFAAIRPVFSIGQGSGNLRPLIIATGVAAILNVVLNLALIPQYGMQGAAVATSLSYGSMFVLQTISARWLGFYPLRDIRFKQTLATALFTFIPLYTLSNVIDSGILSLILIPPVGLAIYTILAFKIGALDILEVEEMVNNFPEPANYYGIKLLSILRFIV